MLYHEQLDVYQLSIRMVASAVAISERLPKGYAPLADQLRRAAMSVPLNIAEGVGKLSKAERMRYHAIARGSATECSAILDVAKLLDLEAPGLVEEAKTLLVRIVEMLTKMCR